MAATKRSQNKCNDCHYTWYPKGKNLSRECPNCKSKNVKIVGPGLGSILGGLVAIGIAIAIFGGNKKPEETTKPVIAPVETGSTTAPAEINTPVPVSVPVAKSTPLTEVVVTQDRQVQVQTTAPIAENERVVTEEELRQMKAQAGEQDRNLTSDASPPTGAK